MKDSITIERSPIHISELIFRGHESNVWSKNHIDYSYPWYIDIAGAAWVSAPCWSAVADSAEAIVSETLYVDDHDLSGFYIPRSTPPEIQISIFFYSEFELAREMALKVQKSAMNKRKNSNRQARLKEAGGFYDQEVVDKLFEIQKGKCYYSGEELTKEPKNFDVDHLMPVYDGGDNWPENLALVKPVINKKKGSNRWCDGDIILWLSETKGDKWAQAQFDFMEEVDKQREKYDKEFRKKHEK